MTRTPTALLGCLLTFGCGSEPSEPSPQSVDDPPETPAASANLTEMAPSLNDTPSPTAQNKGLPSTEGAPANIQAFVEAFEAAQDPSGDTPCEQAYNSMGAMMQTLQKRLPNAPASQPPDRDLFLAHCSDLPEAAQRCLNMSYGMAHQEECIQVMESDDVKEKVEALRRRLMSPAN